MELYQLKSFAAVAREKNLTRAARVIHISQSALSTQIKALEDELGVALFKRTSRGMELTVKGTELLKLAETTLNAADNMVREAGKMKQELSGSITIGMNSDPTHLKMTRINRLMNQRHPAISVGYIKSQTLKTDHMLRHSEIDLGFIYGRSCEKDIMYRELTQVDFFIVIPINLVPAGPEPGWKEIAGMPWIWAHPDCPTHVCLQKKLDRFGLIPNPATEAIDEDIVIELVKDGVGLGIMRMEEALPLVESGQARIWKNDNLAIPLGLAWLKARDIDPLIQATRQVIEKMW